MKIKVCVLYGGSSAEREVSESTAKNITESLNKEKYDITKIEIPKDLKPSWIERLLSLKPQIAVLALHGGLGENGSVQGLLNCLGIPFIGSGVLGSALGINKHYTKNMLRFSHIPTPESLLIRKNSSAKAYEEGLLRLGYPIILKPNCGGSSINVFKCEDFYEAAKAAKVILKDGDDCLCEKYIEGREISCIVTENENGLSVLSVMDINSGSKIYDYSAKYVSPTSLVNTSTLPRFMWAMIEEVALKTFAALSLRGCCAVDMIVREEQLYVIEVNTLPGFAPNSVTTNTLKALGVPLSSFLDSLIDFRLGK